MTIVAIVLGVALVGAIIAAIVFSMRAREAELAQQARSGGGLGQLVRTFGPLLALI